MKHRIVIPNQGIQPLPGETPADAIHRAVIGRVVREVPVERKTSDKDETSQELVISG